MGTLRLGGSDVRELVSEFGSPLYVYDEGVLRQRTEELKDAIGYPRREIKYACKANTNIGLMRIFREEDLGIDAVSPGEIYAALTAGFSPESILLTANNASLQDMDYAVQHKVMVNIDSLSQLERFGERYPGSEVCVRINPNVGGGHHNHVITGGPESKFGISHREVDRIKQGARDHRLTIRGVHQHIGSGILETETFVQAMDVLLETAILFEDLDFVDFGGGIGVPSREEERRIDVRVLGRRISEEFGSFCGRYGRELKLVIEPGRYLVAECGFLLATVTSVKEEERHRFVGVDTGFNHLVRSAMYGSYHPILNATSPSEEPVLQVIAGNLCESGDIFTRDQEGIVDRLMPRFTEGDLVCIGNAGAYGFSMASRYCSRPLPAEVLVKEGTARLIRRRETIEELFDTVE